MHYVFAASLWYVPKFIFLESTSESTPRKTSLDWTEMAAQLTRQGVFNQTKKSDTMFVCGFLTEQIWAPVAKCPQANKTTAAMFIWEISLNPKVKGL